MGIKGFQQASGGKKSRTIMRPSMCAQFSASRGAKYSLSKTDRIEKNFIYNFTDHRWVILYRYSSLIKSDIFKQILLN